MGDDVDFLGRMSILASVTPCTIAKADLLRLLELAGLHDTVGRQMVEDHAGDPLVVDAASVLMAISYARLA